MLGNDYLPKHLSRSRVFEIRNQPITKTTTSGLHLFLTYA